uniref:Myoglobin n=1 Tax=Galeorhinus galeus TaxID=86063 RepID=MYG_GALGA|nr:RecName: Full=Myoglobin [Galeorhinus galeus]
MADWDKVNSVWSAMEANITAVGQNILLRLFEQYPESQSYFPKLKNKSLGELKDTADIKAQADTVLKALGNIVKKKGNHSQPVKALAATHITTHKIPPHYFTKITTIAVGVLSEMYPSEMNAQAQEAFSGAFKSICSDIEKEYKAANFQG